MEPELSAEIDHLRRELGRVPAALRLALAGAAIALPLAVIAPYEARISGFIQDHFPWLSQTDLPTAIQFDSSNQPVSTSVQDRLYSDKNDLEKLIQEEQSKIYPDLHKIEDLKSRMHEMTEKYPFLLSRPPERR